jgi:hypothetical protein
MRRLVVFALLPVTLLAVEIVGCEPNRTPEVLRLVGAGDIASCGERWDTVTGRLMSVLPGRAFAAGDMQYDGSNWSCWEDSWGEENLRMHPSTGNHEDAASFMDYWSTRGMWRHDSVGTLDGGYYFDVGGVRVFSLNSQWNIAATAQFLRNHSDGRLCEIAIWHHPYVSDGELGQLPPSDPRYADVTKVRPLWEAAYDSGIDLVINGHDHNYQRFTLMDREGDLAGPGVRGVREIVVGTGGRHLNRYVPNGLHPASRVYDSNSYGILEVALHRVADEGIINFEFHVADTDDPRDSGFTDKGEFTCQSAG